MKNIVILMLIMLIGCSKNNINESNSSTNENIDKELDSIKALQSGDISINPILNTFTELNINSGNKKFVFEILNNSSEIGKLKVSLSDSSKFYFDTNQSTCGIFSYKKVLAGKSCVISVTFNSDNQNSGLIPLIINIINDNQQVLKSYQHLFSLVDSNNEQNVNQSNSINSCKTNNHIEGRKCLSNIKNCSILPQFASAGTQLWSNGIWGSCQITQCLGDKKIFNNECMDISRTCITRPDNTINGSESLTNIINGQFIQGSVLEYGVCSGFSCINSNYTLFNNSCMSNQIACTDSLGYGHKNLNALTGQYESTCILEGCNDNVNYMLSNNQCVPSIVYCDINNYYTLGNLIYDLNATGVSGAVPNCAINSCSNGYTPNSNNTQCVESDVACTIINNDTRVYPIQNVASPNSAIGFGETPATVLGSTKATILMESDGGYYAATTSSSGNYRGAYLQKFKADGSQDASFNMMTKRVGQISYGANAAINTIIKLSNGQLLLGGSFTQFQGYSVGYLAKINADGTPDIAFNTNIGTKISRAGSIRVLALVEQSDGKLLVGGMFSTFNGTARSSLMRLNADGTPDTTFNTNLGVIGEGTSGSVGVKEIKIQSDGKILIGGAFQTIAGVARKAIARILTTGALDTTFTSPLTTANDYINNMIIDSSGKIYIAGKFAGSSLSNVVRLTSTGSIDTAFSTGTNTTGLIQEIFTIALDSTNNALYAGGYLSATTYKGVANSIKYLVKLDTTTGNIASGWIPTNKYYKNSGEFYESSTLATAGNLSTVTKTETTSGLIGAIALQPITNKLIVLTGGEGIPYYDSTFVNGMMRINSNGSLDTTFNKNTTFLAILPAPGSAASTVSFKLPVGLKAIPANNNKLVVISGSTTNNQITHFGQTPISAGVIRLNSDGIPDSTWTQKMLFASDTIFDIIKLDNGNFLIGGNLTYIAGTTNGSSNLKMLDPNGLVRVSTFSNIAGYNLPNITGGTVRSIELQPNDRKILVGGNFTTLNGIATNGALLRYNQDMTNDGSFTVNNGLGMRGVAGGILNGATNTALQAVSGAYIQKIKYLKNGKIMLGGNFNAFDFTYSPNLVMLNNDGTINTTFSSNFGWYGLATPSSPLNSNVNAIEETSDGGIIVGGKLTMYNNSNLPSNGIVKFNADGTLDTQFNANLGTGAYLTVGTPALPSAGTSIIYDIKIQPDGKILVAGFFNKFNGYTRNYLVRLNSNGTVDTSFDVNFNNSVRNIYVKDNGKYVVTGDFSEVNGQGGINAVAWILDNNCVSGFTYGF